ncbi:hypothetical protein GCM10027446_02960 [Angustibacter peucedani]
MSRGLVAARGLLHLGGALVPWRRLPATLPDVVRAARAHRLTLGGLLALAAARDPDAVALDDDAGRATYRELDDAATTLAVRLHPLGRNASRPLVASVCRDARSVLVTVAAGGRVGADVLLVHPDLPLIELGAVLARERPAAVVIDHDLPLPDDLPRVDVREQGRQHPVTTHRLPRPRRQGRLLLMTSGTTGLPKGADRGAVRLAQALPIGTLAGLLPWHRGTPLLVTAPAFHGFGLGFLALGVALGAPVVVRARLDDVAAVLERGGARVLVGVPTTLSRVERRVGRPVPLDAVVSGAGPLHPSVVDRLRQRFGDVVHDLYGSTEQGWTTVATPRDLAAAPGTVGRPAAGVRVAVLDDDGRPVPVGTTGQVAVGSVLRFAGYTDLHHDRPHPRGLHVTGDLGHLDADGRLHLAGRADDVVVVGGENVLLGKVEAALLEYPAVVDAAVEAAPDADLGHRLLARVVVDGPVPDDGWPVALAAHLAPRLARFERPRELVVVDELPRRATGALPRD